MVSIPHVISPLDAAVESAVLGLDIGGTKLAAGVVDPDGRVRSHLRAPTPASATDWQPAIDSLLELGHRAMEAAGVSHSDIAAVGIGSGGPLDAPAGRITRPPNLPAWDDVPVARLVEASFARPTFLENDANAAALASVRWGTWMGTKDLVYMTISTGVGAGVLIDGKLLKGSSGNVAEVGHAVVAWRGRACDCGQRGCAEAYVSGRSIARRAVEAIGAGRSSMLSSIPAITAADVSAAAAMGDELSVEVWDETTEILGALVTSILNIFEPEAVILGGGVTAAGPMLLDPVLAYARTHALSSAGRAATVAITNHGGAIGILGSAAVAFTRLEIESVHA